MTRKRWASELINELESIGIVLFEGKEFRTKSLLKLINSISSEETDGLKYLEECFLELFDKLEISIPSNDMLELHWTAFLMEQRQDLKIPILI